MTDFVSRKQLERLHELLQAKLQKLAVAPVNDADTELSMEILLFVDFLVSKEIKLAERHNVGYYGPGAFTHPPQQTYWSTHTGTVMPYGKPSTICDNCWQNCNGKHTHCTHMLLNDAE